MVNCPQIMAIKYTCSSAQMFVWTFSSITKLDFLLELLQHSPLLHKDGCILVINYLKF